MEIGYENRILRIEEDLKLKLKLLNNTVSNNFNVIIDFLTFMAENCEGFEEWYLEFIKSYVGAKKSKRFEVVFSNLETIREYAEKSIEILGIKFEDFVDRKKAKNSILFEEDDIKEIQTLSCCLKMCSIISNTDELRMTPDQYRMIYDKLSEKCVKMGVIEKIFRLVLTRTYSYKHSDRYMWTYLRKIQNKRVWDYALEIFVFIMNNILIVCKPDKNPITYFVGVIDESTKWFINSVYKLTVRYDESISVNIYERSSSDSLKAYCIDDSMTKLLKVSHAYCCKRIENKARLSFLEPEDEITSFHARMKEIEFTSPLFQCLSFPVMAEILTCPYQFISTISPENATIISAYLSDVLRKCLPEKKDYRIILKLLCYYPTRRPSVATTYRLKNAISYIKEFSQNNSFLGFSNPSFLARMISTFVGRLARVQFRSTIDGKLYGGIPMTDLEEQIMKFSVRYFSNQIDFKPIKESIVKDIMES